MQQRVNDFEKRLEELFLACPDTTLSPSAFAKIVTQFSENASKLHEIYIKEAVAFFMDDVNHGDLSQLPRGMTFKIGRAAKDGVIDLVEDLPGQMRQPVEPDIGVGRFHMILRTPMPSDDQT
jgi:hypothetical protein